MATYKTSLHTRSISLPPTTHPLDASIENHFRRLRASQAGPSLSSPSSSSSLCQVLCSLKELHEQLNDSIHLPHNQVALSHEKQRVKVEKILDESLALLDTSSFALDVLTQLKESVLDLKSAFRRGSNNEGIHEYMLSRKKLNKALSKCLAELKKAEDSVGCKKLEADCCSITGMLNEAETISLMTLKSLLSYVMAKKVHQSRGWSVINKVLKSKGVSPDSEIANEVENIDHVLVKYVDAKVVMKQLETLESVVVKLEDGLESVSRCFVKTRVSLLNVLNH